MNPQTLITLRAAYAVLADTRHSWPGRNTAEGQALLCDLRDAITAETGEDTERAQARASSGLPWMR